MASLKASCAAPAISRASAAVPFARPALPSRRCTVVRAQAGKDAVAEVSKIAVMGATVASFVQPEHAQAAQEVASLAASDNRIGAIATLFVPALGWVGFNMLQPALNQLGRMTEMRSDVNPSAKPAKSSKRRSIATAVGLGAAASMLLAENADAATEVAQLAASDNRVGAIATLFLPALGWVGFNMLQPALNQLQRMTERRSEVNPSAKPSSGTGKKRRSIATAVGLGAAASMLLVENADAATEVAQLAASDNRIGAIATLFVPALGWVGFNMLQPALNQLGRMTEMRSDVNPSAKPAKASSKRRSVATAVGLGAAASMLLVENADAATEIAQLAASDNRIGAIATLFVPALGWVGFNMLQPALNQISRQAEIASQASNSSAARPAKSSKRK